MWRAATAACVRAAAVTPPPPPLPRRAAAHVRRIASGTTNGIKWFDSSNMNTVRHTSSGASTYLIPLGTSSGSPQRYRNVSATLLITPEYDYLFDCGENTQLQLRHCYMARLGSISRIFVTHLHGDHVFGLPSLISSFLDGLSQPEERDAWRRGIKMSAEGGSDARPNRLTIYGPLGLHAYLSASLATHHPRQKAAMPVDVVELLPPGTEAPAGPAVRAGGGVGGPVKYVKPDAEGTYYLHSNYVSAASPGGPATSAEEHETRKSHRLHDVRAALMRHSVHCVGYVVAEKPRVKLRREVLSQHGLPEGEAYREVAAKLRAGQSITAPDGVVLSPAQACTSVPGCKVVVLGDNCDASCMVPLAQDADVVVHEATLLPGEEDRARQRGHATPIMAGAFARACRAKALMLTHFGAGVAHSYAACSIQALGMERVTAAVRQIELAEQVVSSWAVDAPPAPRSGSGSGGGGGKRPAGGSAHSAPVQRANQSRGGPPAAASGSKEGRPSTDYRARRDPRSEEPPPAGGFSERASQALQLHGASAPSLLQGGAAAGGGPPQLTPARPWRRPLPCPRGSRALSSWGGIALGDAAQGQQAAGGADPSTARHAAGGDLDEPHGGDAQLLAGGAPRDSSPPSGLEGGDAPRLALTLTQALRMATAPRSTALLRGILETVRVSNNPGALPGGKPGLVAHGVVTHTTHGQNLTTALQRAFSAAESHDAGVDFVRYSFPEVSEHVSMQPVVKAARVAFGSPRVIAARDFMALVLDPSSAECGSAGSAAHE